MQKPISRVTDKCTRTGSQEQTNNSTMQSIVKMCFCSSVQQQTLLQQHITQS